MTEYAVTFTQPEIDSFKRLLKEVEMELNVYYIEKQLVDEEYNEDEHVEEVSCLINLRNLLEHVVGRSEKIEGSVEIEVNSPDAVNELIDKLQYDRVSTPFPIPEGMRYMCMDKEGKLMFSSAPMEVQEDGTLITQEDTYVLFFEDVFEPFCVKVSE
jgi:hypothetical protein